MLLSVDGGATKTVAIIFDEEKLKIEGVGLSGPSNLTSAGPVQAKNNIESAIKMAIAKLSVSVKELRAGIFWHSRNRRFKRYHGAWYENN